MGNYFNMMRLPLAASLDQAEEIYSHILTLPQTASVRELAAKQRKNLAALHTQIYGNEGIYRD